MSLQQAANHLAAQGRGGDTTLVHMAPGEVKSLQQLAMAHGGSLTVNPQTGLPEAGFLQSLLPAVIGAGLMATGVGAPMAALMVGGGYGLASGSLSKGLMAGLGAYGGANMADALMRGGASATAAGISEANAAQAAQAAQAAPGVTVGGPISSALPQSTPLGALPPMSSGSAGVDAMLGADGLGGGVVGTPAPGVPVAAPGASSLPPIDYNQMGSVFEGNEGIKQLPKTFGDRLSAMGSGFTSDNLADYAKNNKLATAAMFAPALIPQQQGLPSTQRGGPNPYQYQYSANTTTPFPQPDVPEVAGLGQAFGRENRFFTPTYTRMAGGGPVEAMSNANAVGANTGYPMADISRGAYATPYQQPISQNVLAGDQDTRVDPYTGEERLAKGGLSHLGDYSDGGRLLRGPGDGVSDSIPAVIGNKQPARLADGEFVVPARIVSELGNGSTEAGARKLYAMMDRVQKARGKTTGKGKVAKNTKADKYLPA